ncbi:hypothetical protein ASD77_13385 [Pseudoxanthomonas sp. Root65]|nr:hypothetical protein ASD77_13385 [Pseudoxanthomonas sp. Root65]
MAAVSVPRNSTTVRKSWKLAVLSARFAVGSWLAPRATLARAFQLFCTPMPGARTRARQAETGGARLGELAFGRERLATYTWGDPQRQPTVLLVHGWSSFGLRFLPWVEPLRRAGYAVVAFDQPAHGRSSGRRATLPMFAHAAQRVADSLGPLAAIVGHSLGGAAAAIAMANGLQAERVILLAPAADPFDAARRFGGMVGLAQFLSRRLFDDYQELTAHDIRDLHAQATAPQIARPGLIVHDLEDTDVPWCEGERYARYWPQATLLSTTGLGHHRVTIAPETLEAALRFLRGEPVGQRVVSTRELPFGLC